MSTTPIHGIAAVEKFGKRECCRCEENWSKRKKVLEDDVFIENTRLVSGSKKQDLNLRAPT